MSELTPEQIFNGYKNKELDLSTAILYLKTIIENSDKENERVEAIRQLKKLQLKTEEDYKFLENLMVSDANDFVRAKAASLILQNYLNLGEGVIKWSIDNDTSVDFLWLLYKRLTRQERKEIEHLTHRMEQTFGGKYIENYNIVPSEAVGLGLLELELREEIVNAEDIPGAYENYADFELKAIIKDHFKPRETLEIHVVSLGINGRSCRKIRFLEAFPYLKRLVIHYSGLEELYNLKYLQQLEQLVIQANPIKELINLRYLTNLKWLCLNSTEISCLEGIDQLTNLERIEFEETKIPDSTQERIEALVRQRKDEKKK